MAQPSHIFIVGSFRSGTSLLRNILNRSENVGLSGETKFIGAIISQGVRRKLAKIGNLSTDAGIHKIVDYIYSDRKQTYFWQWIQTNVPRQDFLQKLLESDRTDRALFDLAMSFYANGKPIRGEKTPVHIYYVPTLMEWFPHAKIIHTLRDPRAIFVSERRKRLKQKDGSLRYRILRQSKLVLEIYVCIHVLVSWLRIVHLHQRYQKLYPNNYYLSRYEDFVSDPQTHLKKMCDFLEIDFQEEMITQTTVVNSSFTPRHKRKQGFDMSAIDRWRNHLHPNLNKMFVFLFKKHLLEFGYQL